MNRLAALRNGQKPEPWSQFRLYREMANAAAEEGGSLPEWHSMKGRISKWENGHVVPDQYHRELLCQVLKVSEDELGFSSTDREQEAGLSLPLPVVSSLVVTPDVAGFLKTVFEQYVQADRMLGPRTIIGVVREQCRMIDSLVHSANGDVREDLLRVGSQFFEFGGWLAQDSGDYGTAGQWSSRALDMAYEAGDSRLVAYTFMRRSNIATDSGNPTDGLGLAQAALRESARLGSPRLHALALRQQANALALSGDERRAAKAIEDAIQAVGEPGEPEPDGWKYCTEGYLQMEGAAAWIRLGRPDKAAEMLSRALDTWGDRDQRDRGIGLARLATVYAMAGRIDAACEKARDAIAVATVAPSARAVKELVHLRKKLAPWRRVSEVVEVIDSIKMLA